MKKELVIQPIEQSGLPGLPKFKAVVDGLPEGHVVANPELEGGEPELEALQIGEEKFALPSGGTSSGLKLYDHDMQNDTYELHIISAVSSAYESAAAALADSTVIAVRIIAKATSSEGLFMRSATQGHFNFVAFTSEGATVTDVDGASLVLDHVTEIVNPSLAKKSVRK